MTDAQYLQYIKHTLHEFIGMKLHLVLEDNYIDPKDDLNDAMSLISNLLTDLETHLQIKRDENIA